jgi:hypothetical protein
VTEPVTESSQTKRTGRAERPNYSAGSVRAVQCWSVSVMLLEDGTTHAHLARMNPVTRQMAFLCLPEGTWSGDESEAIRHHVAESALDARLDQEAVRMGW